MYKLDEAIKTAGIRFEDEISNAINKKNEDSYRVERRKNESYSERLILACLNIGGKFELNDYCYALSVAIPEILLSKIFYLAWGNSRLHKKMANLNEDSDIYRFYKYFDIEAKINKAEKIIPCIKNKEITESLICHSLSPIDDTILLLADIGRSIRISNSLEIENINVLLADISWAKYNRSINKYFEKNSYLTDQLRICRDKRIRIYEILGLKYKSFMIKNHTGNIHEDSLKLGAEKFRKLAKLFWGDAVLNPHDSTIQKLVGTSLNKLSRIKDIELPEYMKEFLSFDNFSKAIDECFKGELKALRTISKLFSTFDEDIFIYYFAQYFAQNSYDNYIKIAPNTEEKFDMSFIENKDHFRNFYFQDQKNENPNTENNEYQIYLSNYKLGKMSLLPYTSLSIDALNYDNTDEFIKNTILLGDFEDNEVTIDKIKNVLMNTPIYDRSRLFSDLLSFCNILIHKSSIIHGKKYNTLKNHIFNISKEISKQIFSKDTLTNCKEIFSQWIKSIEKNTSLMPFHLIPYFWDEKEWENKSLECSRMINCLLYVVNEICE